MDDVIYLLPNLLDHVLIRLDPNMLTRHIKNCYVMTDNDSGMIIRFVFSEHHGCYLSTFRTQSDK